MNLEIHELENGRIIKIDVPERFSFDIHSDLRKTYEGKNAITGFIIDLGKTNYLDSSALGMLLQLREHAGDKIDSVRVINARGNVKEILKVANFEQMVTID